MFLGSKTSSSASTTFHVVNFFAHFALFNLFFNLYIPVKAQKKNWPRDFFWGGDASEKHIVVAIIPVALVVASVVAVLLVASVVAVAVAIMVTIRNKLKLTIAQTPNILSFSILQDLLE